MNNTLLKKFFNFGFLIIVIAVFIIRGFKVINRLSPTYDEPVHLIQGYAYLKTGSMDIIYLDDHPVLAKILSAIPLMFLKPQPVLYTNHIYWQNRQRYLFANLMLYYNNYSAEKLLNFGRKMMIILSALFVIPFYIIISKNINKTSAMIACLLYCFNTSIAAHSCLITQDMIASIFYFLCIYGFLKYIITKNVIEMLICSLFTGVMMVTKYSVVVLLFTYVVLLSYFWYKKIIKFNEILKFCIFIISGIVIVGMIVYNVNFLDLFYGLEKVIYLTQQGRSTYFFGKFSTKGFLLYFPILFCLKTELPLLLVFIMSVVKFFHDVVKKKDTIEDTIVFVSIFIYIIISSFSKMQIGHRHLLPVYPLIIWQSCKLATFKKIRTIYYLIIIWNAFVSAKAYPWYISYFNEIIGGSENGWKHYTDSNIDWGQGLKELSIWIKKILMLRKVFIFHILALAIQNIMVLFIDR
ncbi:MAG: glycosyltransferase family 39 protein [Endomicrobia bacterium]|nr:glycosyltransferase family 39 protein [Endomicrobiia bacterium]MDW8055533.1 glycosyltransferase family 39 protein [Elusimicrobiota bacterium]